MRWLLANPLKTLPPIGLVAIGALVGVAGVPVVKKTARSLAVLTVRGALAVNDVVKGVGGSFSRGWEQMVQQAREQQPLDQQNNSANDFASQFVEEPESVIEVPPANTDKPKSILTTGTKKAVKHDH